VAQKLTKSERAMADVTRQNTHRRNADIGNGGKPSGSGGSKGNSEPRESVEKRSIPAKEKAPAYGSSGLEQAMAVSADKLHPTGR